MKSCPISQSGAQTNPKGNTSNPQAWMKFKSKKAGNSSH